MRRYNQERTSWWLSSDSLKQREVGMDIFERRLSTPLTNLIETMVGISVSACSTYGHADPVCFDRTTGDPKKCIYEHFHSISSTQPAFLRSPNLLLTNLSLDPTITLVMCNANVDIQNT